MTTKERADSIFMDFRNSIKSTSGKEVSCDVVTNAAIVSENIAFEREVKVLKAFRNILGDDNYTKAYNKLRENHSGTINDLRAR